MFFKDGEDLYLLKADEKIKDRDRKIERPGQLHKLALKRKYVLPLRRKDMRFHIL